MPRARGPGRRARGRPAHRPIATFLRCIHEICPPAHRPDAAVHEQSDFRPGTRRHFRLSAIEAQSYAVQGHPTAQSIVSFLWRRRPAGDFSHLYDTKTSARCRRHENQQSSTNLDKLDIAGKMHYETRAWNVQRGCVTASTSAGSPRLTTSFARKIAGPRSFGSVIGPSE